MIGNLYPVDPKSKMRIAGKLRKETGPFPTTYFSFSKSGDLPDDTCTMHRKASWRSKGMLRYPQAFVI